MAENRETGIYNATGPAKPLGVGEMLDGIKGALKSDAKFTWVSEDFLTKQKVQPWSDMPVWTGKDDAVARTNISRALSKGLTFRPLDVTARDTLAWFKSLPQERQSHPKAGLSAEREAEVLAAWTEQANKSKQESKNSGK
jgi:2'-hydroxyisoflavone reductase